MNTDTDVLIVGGGPAGLAAAAGLSRLGVKRVVVAEREAEAGGAPRHCNHTGFGVFDMKRLLTGPAYAHRRVELLRDTPVELLLSTSVLDLDLSDPGTPRANTISPHGVATISSRVILFAAGCRERTRASMLVPGDRPAGVLSTGSLQQLIFLKKIKPGNRAVVVGAENVSFSAVQSLHGAGVEVAAVITDHPSHQAYRLYRWYTAGLHGVPVYTRTSAARINGGRRVESVTLQADGGEPFEIACDTVVFTGGFTPESDLARRAGLDMDSGTGGPAVDHMFRTSSPGVFAAGNALRGAETADTAAIEGAGAALSISRYLAKASWPSDGTRVRTDDNLTWVFPGVIPAPERGMPGGGFTFRTRSFVGHADIRVLQGDRLLHSESRRVLIPNRTYRLDGGWVRELVPFVRDVMVCCVPGDG
jgi:thioredoxin reductase